MDRPSTTGWRWVLGIWLAGRILLSLWGVILWNSGLIPPLAGNEHYYQVEPAANGLHGALAGVWQRWDGLHYQRIAAYGYHNAPELSAFFPLYPLLARSLSQLTGIDILTCLLIISSLAFLLLLRVFYQIAADELGPSAARGASAALALFPTAFFFYAPYPHALSLLLTLLAYRCARRAQWIPAAAAGLAAGLSHSTVLPLALMLAWEVLLLLKGRRSLIAWTPALVPLTPLLGTALFLAWRIRQGFPEFSSLMSSIWGREVQAPWQTLIDIPLQFQHGPVYGSLWTDLLALLAAFAVLVWGLKQLRFSQWLYQASLLLYLLTTSVRNQPLTSFGRYALMLFPMFLCAGLLASRKSLRLAGFALGVLLQLFLSGVFILWGWVD